MKVPLFKVFMAPSCASSVAEVLNSGFVGEGPKSVEFANALKDWFSTHRVATTNSGTSAEHLALRLLKEPYNVADGSEVLATPLTCTATNWPILANNLRIKWVDVDPATLNMDLDDLERKLSPTTKVIFLVHWGGYPVDLDRVATIVDKCEKLYGFRPAVIEDCAHAFGSEYKGKKIGTHGNFCTFSFQAIKHLTSVDGGMLVCPDDETFRRAKLLRWYGIDRETERTDFRCELDIPEWGYKFHMNDVMATVGLENIKHVDDIIKSHRDNAQFYDQQLNGCPGVEIFKRCPDSKSSFWIYSMYVNDKANFIKHMKSCGVAVSQVHERNDIHTCVKDFSCALPNLDKITPRLISIPVGWWVDDEQRQYVVDCIKRGW